MVAFHSAYGAGLSGTLQEGIYYSGRPGNSFALVFLRISEGSNARQVGDLLTKLWSMYQDLKKGIVEDLSRFNLQNPYSGNLTVLMGYSPKVFSLPGVRRKQPDDFGFSSQFLLPEPAGGGQIAKGSGIAYANDVVDNHAIIDQILVQFIADTDLATFRAVVETWKMLYRIQKDEHIIPPLTLRTFYTGFQRHDNRSWLGFHDGLSNIKSAERVYAIGIPNSRSRNNWLANGTYLCFMRIVINLDTWQDIDINNQEVLIGRDKKTGCPVIGVDSNGVPIKDSHCPVRGTSEITEPGNDIFREHPPYGSQSYLAKNISDSALTQSHIGRTRHMEGIPPWKTESSRIYRQGFEFLEPIPVSPFFRVGLNFVSFQNSPARVFKILSTPGWLGKTNFAGDPERPIGGMDRLLNVRAAGIFLVPPLQSQTEPFPGSSMFI